MELLRPKIPEPLLECPSRPTPPGEAATQRDAALYLIALAEAHGHCRDRLLAVAKLLKPPTSP